MKEFIFILVAGALSGFAAEPTAAVKDAVTKAEAAWRDAMLKGDRAALESLVADDLSYTHSSTKTQTKKELIDEAAGGALHYKQIDFEETKMRQYGPDAAVITHWTTISTAETGTSRLYLVEVWARVKGKWQLADRQATKPAAHWE